MEAPAEPIAPESTAADAHPQPAMVGHGIELLARYVPFRDGGRWRQSKTSREIVSS
jgi:hypothetical protein